MTESRQLFLKTEVSDNKQQSSTVKCSVNHKLEVGAKTALDEEKITLVTQYLQ
jgi:hypothetical protein